MGLHLILDIGCGSGYYQKQSKFRGQINADILKPRKKIPNFILCDAHHLPFKSRAFNKVFFLDVIEHVESPPKCLREIKRVTEGVIIIGTPNALFFPKIVRTVLKGSYVPYSTHIVTYGVPELTNLLKYVGFKHFEVKPVTYQDMTRNKLLKSILRSLPAPLKNRQILATIYENARSRRPAQEVFVSFIITTCRKKIETITHLKTCPIPHEIIISRKKGLGHARNWGARVSDGNILVYVDDDLKILPKLFDHILTLKKGSFKIAYQNKMPVTRCLIIHKEDFEKVRFTDEIKLSGEDREFFMAAIKSGLKHLFLSPRGLYEHQEHEIRFRKSNLTSIKMMYEHAKVLATHGAYMRFYTGFLSWLIPYRRKKRGKGGARSYGRSAFWYALRDAFLIFAVFTLRRYRKK